MRVSKQNLSSFFRPILFFTPILLLKMALVSPAQADSGVYLYKDSRGSLTITSRKIVSSAFSPYARKPARYSKIYTLKGNFRLDGWSAQGRSSDYDTIIQQTAEEFGLEPALVKAVVHVESSFNAEATSPKGAMGLMQLMPATAQRFGVTSPYQPSDNIRGGVTYLKWLHERYDGNLRLVLAAYNAGENLVNRVMRVPQIAETQAYVKRVLQMREIYNCGFSGTKTC